MAKTPTKESKLHTEYAPVSGPRSFFADSAQANMVTILNPVAFLQGMQQAVAHIVT